MSALIQDIATTCAHPNYGLLLIDLLPTKKYCPDCHKEWILTTPVKELQSA